MSGEAAFVHSWSVGAWTVTLSTPLLVPGDVQHAVCEWGPALPDRPLTCDEQRQFFDGLLAAGRAAMEHSRPWGES